MRHRARRADRSELEGQLASGRIKGLLVDCFGTLLTRIVPSDEVRALAAARLAATLDLALTESELLARRRAAERELSSSVDGIPRDHTTDSLARRLHRELAPRGLDEDAFVEVFNAVEVAVEASVTEPNRALVDTLRAHSGDRRIALVSDTNLTEAAMRGLLDHHGLGGLFERCFVSSEMGATKRSGHLYPLVLTALGISADEALMVGDNLRSDHDAAIGAGISSIAIEPGRWDAVKRASARQLGRDLHRRLRGLVTPVDGGDVFPEFALTMWLFIDRLRRSLREHGAGNPVFLAREGRFLRELFQRYECATSVLPADRLNTHYLPVSRRATFLAPPGDIGERLHEHIRSHPGATGADVAALVGLDAPSLWSATASDGRPIAPDELDDALGRPEVAGELERRRADQARLLEELVEPLVSDGELHLVDVGWKGTVQDNLGSLLQGRATLTGHFVGLVSSDPNSDPSDKHGLLFTNRPSPSGHYQVFSHFKALYEILLAAPTGSVAGYRRAPDGSVAVVLDDNEDELRCHLEMIAPFQERCATRFEDLSRLLAAHRVEGDEATEIVARHHGRMMYRPRSSELDFVERLVQYENFGRLGIEGIGAPPQGAPRHLRGPRRHISGGGWAPLRMRRAGQEWLRHPYGAFKSVALRAGRLA